MFIHIGSSSIDLGQRPPPYNDDFKRKWSFIIDSAASPFQVYCSFLTSNSNTHHYTATCKEIVCSLHDSIVSAQREYGHLQEADGS